MAEGFRESPFLCRPEDAISNLFQTDLSNWKITGRFRLWNLHLFPKMNMAERLSVTI